MQGKFKVGDEVVNLRPHGWREGIVVAVIAAKESARRYCRKAGMSVRNFPVSGGVRDHESYLVESGCGIYQPSVWRMKLKGKAYTIDQAQKDLNFCARLIVKSMEMGKKGCGK